MHRRSSCPRARLGGWRLGAAGVAAAASRLHVSGSPAVRHRATVPVGLRCENGHDDLPANRAQRHAGLEGRARAAALVACPANLGQRSRPGVP